MGAIIGAMMGQMQEANKDDYNMGAMLRQVGGVTGQEQAQQMAQANGGVGSFINNGGGINAAGGNGPMAGSEGSGGGLGSILQMLMNSNQQQQPSQQAQNPVFSSASAQQRDKPAYDNSGSNTNWMY